jgi:hypothetical protein
MVMGLGGEKNFKGGFCFSWIGIKVLLGDEYGRWNYFFVGGGV